MDRQYIQDQQIIERYLNDQLSAGEAQAFEEYYMTDPGVLEELQLAERLKQGLQALNDAGELSRSRGRNGLPGLFRSPIFAAAASILAVVSIVFSGVTYRENLGLRSVAQRAENPVTTRLIPLISVRGGSDVNVAVTNDDEWTVLLVDAGFTPYDEYRASVTRTDAGDVEPIWQLGGLTPTYDEQIAVGLPGSLLVPGEYEIRIAGRMSDWAADRGLEEVSRMPFTITPAQP